MGLLDWWVAITNEALWFLGALFGRPRYGIGRGWTGNIGAAKAWEAEARYYAKQGNWGCVAEALMHAEINMRRHENRVLPQGPYRTGEKHDF